MKATPKALRFRETEKLTTFIIVGYKYIVGSNYFFFINISFGLNLVSDEFQLFIIGCVRFGCVGAIFLYSHNGFTKMFSHDLFLVL